MSEFLNAILAFPTVLYTILLGVVVLYWLFVILGALDINLLGDADLDGHGHADLDMGGHGHVDALGADGHGHDLHLDGHGHGPADGHGHSGDHHGDADADAGDAEHAGGLAGLIQTLGLGGVPVTLMLSILILAAWSFCLGGTELFGGSPGWTSVAVPLLSLALAVPVTGVIIRPLRRFYTTVAAPQHRDFVGKICTITTLRVDERYGQAEIADGGAGLIVQVRSSGSDRFSRGDRALIFDYKDEVFWIAPVNQALQRDLDNLVS